VDPDFIDYPRYGGLPHPKHYQTPKAHARGEILLEKLRRQLFLAKGSLIHVSFQSIPWIELRTTDALPELVQVFANYSPGFRTYSEFSPSILVDQYSVPCTGFFWSILSSAPNPDAYRNLTHIRFTMGSRNRLEAALYAPHDNSDENTGSTISISFPSLSLLYLDRIYAEQPVDNLLRRIVAPSLHTLLIVECTIHPLTFRDSLEHFKNLRNLSLKLPEMLCQNPHQIHDDVQNLTVLGDHSSLRALFICFPNIIELSLFDSLSNENIKEVGQQSRIEGLAIYETKVDEWLGDSRPLRPQRENPWLWQFPNLRKLQFGQPIDPLRSRYIFGNEWAFPPHHSSFAPDIELLENCLPNLAVTVTDGGFPCPELKAIHTWGVEMEEQFQSQLEDIVRTRQEGGHPMSLCLSRDSE